MEIEKARDLGLCFGVRRAIRMLKEAAGRYGRIETLGPVAHNQQLVEGLVKLGIKPVGELEQVQGKMLAVTTHGVSPTVLSEIEARHINIIDTTCPIVRQAQNAARKLAESGFDVIIFGEAGHSEVEGLLGWAGVKGIAALDAEQVVARTSSLRTEAPSSVQEESVNLDSLGIISQTTQSGAGFSQFIAQLIAALGVEHTMNLAQGEFSGEGAGQFPQEIRIINTLCRATQRRREAAIELAKRSQLMVVVGGHNSANTRHLAEACLSIVETHLVEGAGEVDYSWLVDKHHIGITAGASTPDEAIDEVIAGLKSLAKASK